MKLHWLKRLAGGWLGGFIVGLGLYGFAQEVVGEWTQATILSTDQNSCAVPLKRRYREFVEAVDNGLVNVTEIERDIETLLEEMRRCGEEGSGEADFFLGMMHVDGYFVPHNCAIAKMYLQRAKEKGNKAAAHKLRLSSLCMPVDQGNCRS